MSLYEKCCFCFKDIAFYCTKLEACNFYKTIEVWALLFHINLNLIPSAIPGGENIVTDREKTM